jgi:hypothetical protein
MDLNTLENRLSLLLAKYDINKDNESSDSDMTEIGIVRRENRKLKELNESQKEVIEVFRTKYLDLAIEYNDKIERLRRDHLNELQNIHSQFKERLRKERAPSNKK